MTARRAEAQEVIDILNRWDARMNGHQTQKRAPADTLFGPHFFVLRQATRIGRAGKRRNHRLARNVSPKGIGFVYKGRIEWKRVLLCLDPDAGETTWMHAEIVRSRNVHNDFWDYGVRFIRRAAAEDLPSAESGPEPTTVAEA